MCIRLLILAVLVTMSSVVLHGKGQTGFYIGGRTLYTDMKVEFEGADLDSTIGVDNGGITITSIAEDNNEVGYGVVLGCQINGNHALELEVSRYRWDATGFAEAGGETGVLFNASLTMTPVILNYKYNVNLWPGTGFYGGLGAGLVFADFEEHILIVDDDTNTGSVYQATAGFQHQINEYLSGKVGFRYSKMNKLEFDTNGDKTDANVKTLIFELGVDYLW